MKDSVVEKIGLAIVLAVVTFLLVTLHIMNTINYKAIVEARLAAPMNIFTEYELSVKDFSDKPFIPAYQNQTANRPVFDSYAVPFPSRAVKCYRFMHKVGYGVFPDYDFASPAIGVAVGFNLPELLPPPEFPPPVFDLEVSYHGPSQAAIDEGGIVEYMDRYYAAHDYAAGSIFFEFEPGAIVHIDGRTVVIIDAGYRNYYYDTIEATKDLFGWDKVYFQTCLPEGGGAIIVYYGYEE